MLINTPLTNTTLLRQLFYARALTNQNRLRSTDQNTLLEKTGFFQFCPIWRTKLSDQLVSREKNIAWKNNQKCDGDKNLRHERR